MASSTMAGAKVCRSCGKLLNNEKRMRDSEGKYWCIPCGEADQKNKGRIAGRRCGVCREIFSETQLVDKKGVAYCPKCLKQRQKQKASSSSSSKHSSGGGLKGLFAGSSSSSSSSEGGSNTKRVMVMLAIVAVLAAVRLGIYFL